MKKAIVIASAVISLLISLGMTGISTWGGIKDASSFSTTFFILLAIFLFLALISSAVLFSIKLNRPLGVLNVIMAMVIGFGSAFLFLAMTFTFCLYPELSFSFAVASLVFVPITITCIAYIRMVMKSAGNQGEYAKRWPFKTKAGLILTISAVLVSSLYFIITRDNNSLHKALEGTDQIIVRSGGVCHRNLTEEKILIDEKNQEVVQNIIKNINVNTGLFYDTSCMCCGNPTFEFYKKGQLILSLSFHHGIRLRWADGKWSGDAPPTRASSKFLIKWLDDNNIDYR